MNCPYCLSESTKVTNKRKSLDAVRRRRECLKCNRRFTTYERVELLNLMVVKRNNKHEHYNRKKLLKGLLKACSKRPITKQDIVSIVSEIEASIRKKDLKEVRTSFIGDLVMKKLKKLDKVAYLRFASVYKEFGSIKNFKDEINSLEN